MSIASARSPAATVPLPSLSTEYWPHPPSVAFPINPGTVETDLLKNGRKDPKVVEALKTLPPITPEESARGILEQVDNATRETHGGQFVDYSGLGKWQW